VTVKGAFVIRNNRKLKTRVQSRFSVTGLFVGFGIAVCILRWGSKIEPLIATLLCPTCLAGMATDSSTPFTRGVVTCLIVIGDGLWFALLFRLASGLIPESK